MSGGRGEPEWEGRQSGHVVEGEPQIEAGVRVAEPFLSLQETHSSGPDESQPSRLDGDTSSSSNESAAMFVT